MEKNKKKFVKRRIALVHLAVTLILGLLPLSCSKATAPGEYTLQDELENNHFLLSVFYSWPEEIPPISSVENLEPNSTYGEYTSIFALYDSLSDSYTGYYTPPEAEQVLRYFTESGTRALVGITVDTIAGVPDTLQIMQVLANSPAAEAGVQVGDKILEINEISAVGPTNFEVFATQTAGEEGTEVRMNLLRGDSSFTVAMIKRLVEIPTVYLEIVDGVEVIQITQFVEKSIGGSGTAKEFQDIMYTTRRSNTMVLDLRGNPGGSVDQCIQVADQLLSEGVIIRSIERTFDRRAYTDTVISQATTGGYGENRYVVILIDAGSASCAEIVASAMRTNKQTPLVGGNTFGKGIGQRLVSTVMRGLAKITCLEFRDYTWTSYHGEGLAPDYLEPDPAVALQQAVRLAASLGVVPEEPIITALAKRDVRRWNELNEILEQRRVRDLNLPGAYIWTPPVGY